jgi:xylulokinase
VPCFGWAEQRPADWWDAALESIRRVLETVESAAHRVSAIAACGQMHGTVLIDAEGELALDSVQLWNDKRPSEEVAPFVAAHDVDALWPITANPPSVAWPGFKLQWIARHQPEALARAASLFMPKDYVNFRLTGTLGMDESDASCTYLWDARNGDWSSELTRLLGVDVSLLPPVRAAHALLGAVTPKAAAETGLIAGTPVSAGTSDFAATLLGSGVSPEHRGSDITGTSTLITTHTSKPLPDPVVTNMRTADGAWGAFTILDAGGDAMHWARRVFHMASGSAATPRPAGSSLGSRAGITQVIFIAR